MKIAILLSLARQVEGEFVWCQVVKAHTDPEALRSHLHTTDLPRTANLDGVNCVLEYSVIQDIEVEG